MAFDAFSPKSPFIFDGAMGTYYTLISNNPEMRCEDANINNPSLILSIHREYIDAGCNAVKTNTFSESADIANGFYSKAEQVILSAINICKQATEKTDTQIFADLGPVPSDCSNAGEIYIKQAKLYLENGITCFLAETLPNSSGLEELSAFLSDNCKDSVLIVSFAAGPDGITRDGLSAKELMEKVSKLKNVNAVGLNCMSGPGHLLKLLPSIRDISKPLSVMPNAGYPTVLGRKIVYRGSEEYFAKQSLQLINSGVSIIGGCCGTTPKHIKALCSLLNSEKSADKSFYAQKNVGAMPINTPKPQKSENAFFEKLSSGKKVIAVELDPPENDCIDSFLENASFISQAGADIITVADCPIGRPRADSSIISCILKRELKTEALPHLTCRDRNLNATKALLLGLSAEQIRNVLIVTGDPVPTENRDEVKSVYNFNSRKLIKYIDTLNKETFSSPFRIFAALNINAQNFEIQLELARQKELYGACGFLTQPVLSKRAEKNLMLARKTLKGKILGGIYPIVSHRNAIFLNNEISGIYVDDDIISLYEGKSREECEEISTNFCTETALRIYPYVDGFYLMTPFNRVKLTSAIMARISSL